MKFLLLLTIFTSLSSFAETYKGIDNLGSPCELHIIPHKQDPNKLLVEVETLTIHATSYDHRARIEGNIIDVSNTFTQGNRDYLITTTDRIIVTLENSEPVQFSVTRNKKIKTSGLFNPVQNESLPEVVCSLI